VLVGPLN